MRVLRIVLLFLLLIPNSVLANDDIYVSKNLEEVLKEEGIEYDFSNYKETDDQITIYLFRGDGCDFCRKFLTFLSSITDEYGKYFKVRSYEVWNNKDNNKLMRKTAFFLYENVNGVPFIIIGDEVFPGYNESLNDSIKKAIVDLYNSNNRYDVFKEMGKSKSLDIKTVIIWNVVVIMATTSLIFVYIYNQNKNIKRKLTDIEIAISQKDKENNKKNKCC